MGLRNSTPTRCTSPASCWRFTLAWIGGIPAGTSAEDVIDGAGIVRVTDFVDSERARTGNKCPYRTDIKGLSKLQELLAVGILAANEQRHLQVDTLVSPTLVVRAATRRTLLDATPSLTRHWYPSFSTAYLNRNLNASLSSEIVYNPICALESD